jgi:hypothetical protein
MVDERTVPEKSRDLIDEHIAPEERREWTLMFYFASDNPLAPSIVSQLKALKGAGFHAGANVVAHFDPYTRDTPSHVFEVNVVEKLKRRPGASFIGFDAKDPFVRKLVLDKIWESGEEDDAAGAQVRRLVEELLRNRENPELGDRKLPVLPKGVFERERSPKESLGAFLEFCRKKYPANRYMLFILGHGVVVGNDVFLFDANPGDESDADEDDDAAAVTTTTTTGGNGNGTSVTPAGLDGNGGKPRRRNSLTLRGLGDLLSRFKTDIGDSKFELLSLHSCSMSSAEVAYQLQDTAHYMLASQGPAFVGSWPYRQILLRIFNKLGPGPTPPSPSDAEVREMVADIFSYVVHNSYDFQLAGYSFDVALCDLTQAWKLKESVGYLVGALMEGLTGEADLSHGLTGEAELAHDPAAVPLAREMILLAHWDAQSFWQENYTDLYDFCHRLRSRCALASKALAEPSAGLDAIVEACGKVINVLEKGAAGDDEGSLVMRSEFVGGGYQYAHGVSVYFPWAKPADRFFDRTYVKYEFAKNTGWAAFLDEYFLKTRRATRKAEDRPPEGATASASSPKLLGADEIEKKALELMQVIVDRVLTPDGELAKNGNDDRMAAPGKIGSDDRTGDDYAYPVFKNHPSLTGDDHRQEISQSIGEGVNITTAV